MADNSAMNRFAYRTTALALKAFSWFSRARVNMHNSERIPRDGSLLFVVNHFTRIETLLLPYWLNRLTHLPVWSLADVELFKGALGAYLDKVGAVSTRDPDRDRLMVRSLLTGEAAWVIYPEGRMVKSKKIVEKGRYMISYAGGKHPPHTGAATLALRTEFYRQRIYRLLTESPGEARRILQEFQIEDPAPILARHTYIVPVNLTYYPIRAKENALSELARKFNENISERLVEELMAEGTMFLSGVDIDLRFGKAIPIGECLTCPKIEQDIGSRKVINFDDSLASRKQMRREALTIMQRYMAEIYRLTTVNHDHLFAAMLRRIPFRKVRPDDLKRKVYLLTHQCADMDRNHYHRSLRESQLPLLTDDQYDKFRDFMALALQTDVIRGTDDKLVKNHSRLGDPFEFHRARIDNPLWVIANEIEPLKSLQRCIRRIAWQPAFWTRRKIARFLRHQAMREFHQDYEAFYREGESKPRAIGRPIFKKGRSRNIGVVVVHGYMAAPEEVRGLASYLNRKGYWVYAPRVKGHGTAPEDLAGRTYQEWIRSVEEAYALMSCACRHVVVGGFSNGAGLALEAASRIRAIRGVFAVSPPLQLQDYSARFVPAMDMWNRLMRKVHSNGARREFIVNQPENPQINYTRNPVAGIHELERLMDHVETRLSEVRVPAVVVQSAADPVVDPRGSRRVFDKLGSAEKKYILFNLSRHGILLGSGCEQVHRVIGNFLDDIRDGVKK
jgi:esterase/lipase/1-acyl-sn-glycerol-3-phosphate acyltransferase